MFSVIILFALALDGLRFTRVVLDAESDFEAAGVADVDQDGRLDVICGDRWYAAPDWVSHSITPIAKEGGYRIDFANVPLDVNGDGLVDVVSCNWHRRSVVWRENPGPEGDWIEHTVDEPGNMETALAADVDGDGHTDFLPDVAQQVVWYRVENRTLVRHEISTTIGGHGIGFGDVNGDGKGDVVKPTGWFQAPDWTFHQDFDLGAVGIGILVHDFNGDGLPDLFAGMGHDYGTFWLEQTADPTHRFIRHEIDHDWSQAHALRLADLDGDGKLEVVTGKRKYAHETDPGAQDEMVIFAYVFDRETKTFRRETISRGGDAGLGLAPVLIDIDGDRDIDLIAPGKSGLFLFRIDKLD